MLAAKKMQFSRKEIITNLMLNYYQNGIALPRNTPQDIENFNRQVSYEDMLLTTLRICHPSGNNSINGVSIADLDHRNMNDVLDYVRRHSFDRNVMEAFRCMINVIIDIENNDGDSERNRINKFISNLQQFGADSVYGFPLKGTIRTTATGHEIKGDIIVVKCPREPSNSAELIHELCVGLAGLNALRGPSENGDAAVPFFSYVLDAYYCSPPIISPDKKLEEWCVTGDNPVAYVIYEMINDAISVKDCIQKADTKSISDMMLLLIQTAVGLKYASDKLGYTHNDLHGDNILARNVSKSDMLIELPFRGKNVKFLSSSRIPTIIDYGMSRITAPDGTVLGKVDRSGAYIRVVCSNNEVNTIADMHKLLCFILLYASRGNKQEYIAILDVILMYFYNNGFDLSQVLPEAQKNSIEIVDEKPTDVETILYKQNDFRYTFPNDLAQIMGWTMDGLIDHMCNVYTGFFGFPPYVNDENLESVCEQYKQTFGISYPNKGLPLFCSDETLIDLPTAIENLISTPHTEKETVSEFISSPRKLMNDDIPTLYSLIHSTDKFNENLQLINQNLTFVLAREQSELNKYCSDNVNLVLLNIPNSEEKLNKDYASFERSILKVAKVVDNVMKLFTIVNTLRDSLKYIQNDELKSLFEKSDKYFIKYSRQMIEIDDGINNGYKFLSNLIFGRVLDKPMNEDELEIATKSKYYNLFYYYQTVNFNFESLVRKK